MRAIRYGGTSMPLPTTGALSARARLVRILAPAVAWLAFLGVAAHGYAVGLRALLRPWTLDGYPISDLHVYVGALNALHRDGTLYDYSTYGLPFTYPPFAAIVLAPLRLVPLAVLDLLWPGVILATAVATGVMMAPRLAPLAARWWPEADWWRGPVLPLTITFVTGSQIIMANLLFGQISSLIAVLALADAARIVPARYRGVLVGLTAAVKLTPLIFVPYLWLTGQRRAAGVALGTFAASGGLGWLVMPGDSVRYWFTELWRIGRVGDPRLPGNVSLQGLLTRSGLTGPAERYVWPAAVVVVAVVGLLRAARADRYGMPLLGAAIAGAVSLCVCPVSWAHHALWLVVAAVGAVPLRGWWRYAWLAVIGLVTCVLTANTVTDHAWVVPALHTALSDSLAVLAIAVACLVPVRAGDPQRPQVRIAGPAVVARSGRQA